MIRLRTLEVDSHARNSDLPILTDTDSVDQLAARAEAALAAGKWHEAYDRYSDAIAIERRARDCLGAAVAAHFYNEPEDAVAALELALDQEPQDLDLLLDIATVALHLRQPVIARQAARRALDAGNGDGEAAAILQRIENIERARNHAQVAAVTSMLADLDAPRAELRAIACETLGDIDATEAVPALAKVLAGDASALVRSAAARALGLMAEPAAVAALAAAIGDASPDVRESVARALGTHFDPQALAPLRSLTHDLDPKVNATATRSLAGIEDGMDDEG